MDDCGEMTCEVERTCLVMKMMCRTEKMVKIAEPGPDCELVAWVCELKL